MIKYLQPNSWISPARVVLGRSLQRLALSVVGMCLLGGLVMAEGGFDAIAQDRRSPASQQGLGTTAKPGDTFAARVAAAGIARTRQRVIYDPAYRVIAYPGGDVPADRGVCTDVVIRSYRALGIDLQKLVHEDMRRAFRTYPKRWGLKRPDKNIDHRRVANLRRFFIRHGQSLPVSSSPDDYLPGDLVTWDLARPYQPTAITRKASLSKVTSARTPHIGIVTDRMSSDGKRPLIAHNIGAGTKLEDVLFTYRITGRYRYQPRSRRK